MKLSVGLCLFFIFCLIAVHPAQAQVDSLIAQITSSSANTSVRDISGDGRFVVLESTGDIATERDASRNNADGNSEIFLFDYVQRRIFQITNTRRLLVDNAGSATNQANIFVDITNTRPVIANGLVNNELFIAFTSNAAPSFNNSTPAGANPGNYDGTAITDATARTNVAADANTEIFLYRVTIITPTVDLSRGAEVPFNNLSAGTFIQVTNTAANSPSQPGSTTAPAFISDDNRDVSTNDDALTLAFVSNRNLITGGSNTDFNTEVFVFKRTGSAGSFQQITITPRATENAPIFNQNPSISGDGTRLAFYSNATRPRDTSKDINNSDNNGEAFYATLNADGSPSSFRAITSTTRTNPFDTPVIFSAGRRISRDGRFVGFETISNMPSGGGANQNGYQLYVYDASATGAAAYRAIGPRGDADAGSPTGDVRRFPTFTSVYNRATNTFEPGVVFASRLNFNAAGTVPATASEGLNPDTNRQIQIYSFPLTMSQGFTAAFSRLTRFPTTALNEVQPYASNTNLRVAFNIPRELGGGNPDGTSEAFYLLTPIAFAGQTPIAPIETQSRFTFSTGASALPIGSPQPTPTASPSPTPQTPPVVRGLAPGTLAVAEITIGRLTVSQTATGTSNSRSFPLPIELAGVTVSINNVAAGIYSIDQARGEITFVVPLGLPPSPEATPYALVVNDNGRILRTTIDIVAARPDIFRRDGVIAGGGRASVFNATTGVALQAEPFLIRSIRLRGGLNVVQTRLRVFLTGVQGLAAGVFSIRIGSVTVPAANVLTGAVPTDRPGVYSVDFLLPAEARTVGDAPIVITVTAGGTTFTTRLDDTAPRILIAP